MPAVPFIRASAEHREPTGIDVSRQLTTSAQDLGVFDIPAYGYVRSLYVLVTVSGGTGGAPAVTATEDAPWNRSEEHTSELQSLMRISYAVFCLKKKK